MHTLMPLLLLTACTEPTWYPGLPSGVESAPGGDDSGHPPGGDGGAGDGGGTEDGGGPDGGADGGGDGGGNGLPCSTDGGTPATLTIDVQANLGLILWWRDASCGEWSYGAVTPYIPRDQPTTTGHAWVLRDAVGEYADHRVVTESAEHWEITQ